MLSSVKKSHYTRNWRRKKGWHWHLHHRRPKDKAIVFLAEKHVWSDRITPWQSIWIAAWIIRGETFHPSSFVHAQRRRLCWARSCRRPSNATNSSSALTTTAAAATAAVAAESSLSHTGRRTTGKSTAVQGAWTAWRHHVSWTDDRTFRWHGRVNDIGNARMVPIP